MIVDERVDDLQENRGIEPLPNLEFKFVTANSLLSLEKTSEALWEGSLFGNENHIAELSEVRNSFFSAVSEEKELIRSEFRRVQANMRRGLTQTKSEVSSKYEKLSKWKPFSLDATNWFDAKWMFGLEEFSVVIANPPYLGEKGHKEIFGELKEGSLGTFYAKNMDLFYFFFHQAINLVSEKGIVAFITTNYFPTATGAETLRNDLKNRTTPVEFINFNELKIFDAAPGQHNMVTILEKGKSSRTCRTIITSSKGSASSQVLAQILEGSKHVANLSVLPEQVFEGPKNYIRFPAVGGSGILTLDKSMNPVDVHYSSSTSTGRPLRLNAES